ncbi:MAG: hypothetical protein GWN61_07955 [candidate division Zixibacteria bacterium]|nr:hypothetical protein [candidate division Zixibacteria bacterium]NIS45945.1 hypothetical protein [candidate division Zixibacteria bacterium]NIU14077.1 hypothetical protein [candidate division Zixibacteria bacterium]NIV06110.1 hypothetical protein [candidate division Zixibacteria bacterium]NIW44894.1 hypothetical protein [Gammaproteobacteria bacterium]
MDYNVSLVISPAKGGLGRLFSAKGRMTKGILSIQPESQEIQVRGVDRMVSGVDKVVSFQDIKEIEAKGLDIFMIKLKDGNEIQFKNVEGLSSLLDELGKYCRDATHELVRKRIDKYEDRLRRWGGG